MKDKRATAFRCAAMLLCAYAVAQIPVIGRPPVSDKQRIQSKYAVSRCDAFPSITEKFAGKVGFIGGDTACSVAISPDKTLWIFKEAYFGNVIIDERRDCVLVHNLIALDNQTKSGSHPVFFKRFPAFFGAREQNALWPGSGVMLDGRLFIFFHEVQIFHEAKSVQHITPLTDHLLVVENPQVVPEKWQVQDYRLGNQSSRRLIGNACILAGNYLYVYCSDIGTGSASDKNATVLARISKAALKALPRERGSVVKRLPEQVKVEWLANGWRAEDKNADRLFVDADVEMSVSQVNGLPGYFAFYVPASGTVIKMRHAERPEGPWSKPADVYKISNSLKSLGDDIYLNSPKTHEEYKLGKREIAITYCSKSGSPYKVMRDARIYWPTALKLKLAPAK